MLAALSRDQLKTTIDLAGLRMETVKSCWATDVIAKTTVQTSVESMAYQELRVCYLKFSEGVGESRWETSGSG